MSGNDSYIGLIPFTTMVKLSNSLSSTGNWMEQSTAKQFAYDQTNMSMSKWGGCAVEPHDLSGNVYPKVYAPAGSPSFIPFYYNVPSGGFTVKNYDYNCKLQSTSITKGVSLTYSAYSSGTLCRLNGTAVATPGNFVGVVPYNWSYAFDQNGSDQDSRPCGIQPVVFLTKDSSKLTKAINAMQASGATIIPSGLLWGWRMLSSDWSGAVAGTNNGWISSDTTLPRPESTQGLQRVAILLTDGVNSPGGGTNTMP